MHVAPLNPAPIHGKGPEDPCQLIGASWWRLMVTLEVRAYPDTSDFCSALGIRRCQEPYARKSSHYLAESCNVTMP